MIVTYNYVGVKVIENAIILKYAIEVVKGSNISVAPFDDDLLMQVGVWIKGEWEELEPLLEEIDKKLKNMKVTFVANEWENFREKE